MPFDSEGIFTRIHNWEDDRVNDIEIVSDSHDEEDDNFAAGLSQTVLRDGRASMTGNLNMGGFQIRNVKAGTATMEAVNKSQLDTVNNRLTDVDAAVVHLATAETVTGVKTFDVSPKVPTAAVATNDTTAASTAFVTTAVLNHMPNYAAAQAKSDNVTHTAEADGFIIWQAHVLPSGNWVTYTLTIDGCRVGSGSTIDWTNNCARCIFPIAKGSKYISTGSDFFQFVPMKG